MGKGKRYYRRKEEVYRKNKTKPVRKPTNNRDGGEKEGTVSEKYTEKEKLIDCGLEERPKFQSIFR